MQEEELRKSPMMARMLDALRDGTDIGHYGRLVFAMTARHFMSDDELVAELVNDPDCDEAKAEALVRQVEGADYSPPKRDKIASYQRQQEYRFFDADDPDDGNLYRDLTFPDHVYEHIASYREAQATHGA